uniref:Protein kinase domain-containing protein n=1 Tax=Steinernema glaseri TaxID=37863 RepID=A0A1I7YWT0_9BILA
MDDFYGEIEEIPFNLCGVIDKRWVIVAPFDDPIEREFSLFHIFDKVCPNQSTYLLVPRADVTRNRSDCAVHRTIRVLEAVEGRSVHFPKLIMSGTISRLVFGHSGDQQLERDPEWPDRPVAIVKYEGNLLSTLISVSDYGGVPVEVALAVGIGCVRALAALHRAGFVHRLVSPFSFCYATPISELSLRNRMVIVDLSLAMQWPTKPRVFVPFVGTMRYSSLRVHQGREAGPSDDIISVVYMVAELISGRLPWRSVFTMSKVRELKANFHTSNEFRRLPREIRSVYRSMMLTVGPSPVEHVEIVRQFEKALRRKDPDGSFKIPHYLDV